MSYPFLPPNPCCTATPASSPCATGDPCLIITTDQVKYNGSELLCIGVDPCDTMTTALQKINTKQCSTDAAINSLNSQISIIENQINIINETLISIVNQLDVCCSTTTTTTLVPPTTTTTTTVKICESFLLTNTGETPLAIIITDCNTGTEEAIVLLPGDTEICVETDSPLEVPGTVIVTPTGPCAPITTTTTSSSTSTTTSTTTIPPTTTTTTTAIPCECLTFTNTSDTNTYSFQYNDCLGNLTGPVSLPPNEVVSVCGCCGLADNPDVIISIGENCIDGACPTTTTTTTICPCFTYDVTISLDDINNADDSRVNVNVPLDCNEQVNSKYEFFAPGTFTVCASNVSEPPTQYITQSFTSVPTVDQPVITPECCTITIERGSITSTSELTALSACSAPLDTVAYIESNYVRVFTDPLGTIPFIGDGNFYRIQRGIDDPVTVTARINSDGYVISSITIC